MPRPYTANHQAIHAERRNPVANRENYLEQVVEISFNNITSLYFATSPLIIGANTYKNSVESVSEVKQTLDKPINRVSIQLQNKDNVLRLHYENNRNEWLNAKAVYYRYLISDSLNLKEKISYFRGAVEQIKPTDTTFTIEIVSRLISDGAIVASLTQSPECWKVFRSDACGYQGTDATCSKKLKGVNGCKAKKNEFRFGGSDIFGNPIPQPPGTGGNGDDIIDPNINNGGGIFY
jgi:hypothetical protein